MCMCDVCMCVNVFVCVYIWHINVCACVIYVYVCVCLYVCMYGVCVFVFLCGVIQCVCVCVAPSICTCNFSLPFESTLKHVPHTATKADTESIKGQNRFTHSLFLKNNLVLRSQMLTKHSLINNYPF